MLTRSRELLQIRLIQMKVHFQEILDLLSYNYRVVDVLNSFFPSVSLLIYNLFLSPHILYFLILHSTQHTTLCCSFCAMTSAIQIKGITGQPFYRFLTWGSGWWAPGGSVWVWEIRRSWRRTGWTAPGAALSDRESTRLEKYLHLVNTEWLV